MAKDYYDILDVSKSASAEDIKTAFRKKAHQYHPDKGGDAEKFKEINEAYQVLGNTEKRQKYDQFGSAAFNGSASNWGGFNGQNYSGFQNGAGVNFDFDDLSEMFGGFGDIFGFSGNNRNSSRKSTRGRDIEIELKLDFLEAVFGLEKEINFSKQGVCVRCQGSGAEAGTKINECSHCKGTGFLIKLQRTILGNIQTKVTCSHCEGEGRIPSQKCSQCSGSGVDKINTRLKVKIPAGINEGESIRLSGQGEAGPKGSSFGDLYLRITIIPHKKFIRSSYDVKTEEVLSITQAILGDKIEIETVHGKIKLKIPEGTQSGTIFKLKDKGIPKLHGRGQGDHYVKVNIKIPKNLNKKQKVLLEELNI